MKNMALILTSLFCFNGLYAQLNPVDSLTLEHTYDIWSDCPYFNCFSLGWNEPDSNTHDTLIGYNIYRNMDLYRFQDYIGVSCGITPCPDEDFMWYYDSSFWTKVKAVYNSTHTESIATDSVFWGGMETSVNPIENNLFRIANNPVNKGEHLILCFPQNPKKCFNVKIYSMDGRMVVHEKITTNMKKVYIQTQKLETGVYNVILINENELLSGRIIVR